MAHVLLTTLGSYGDLYPYLALRRLTEAPGPHGHRRDKRCLSPEGRVAIARVLDDWPDVSLDNREMMEYLFHQRLGTERVLRKIANVTRETYEDTLPAVEKADVVVTHPITFAAVVAVQKLRKPWVSSVLAPISFLSAYDPPVPAPFPPLVRLRALGPGVMRAVWNLGKKASLPWVKPVFQLRRELG